MKNGCVSHQTKPKKSIELPVLANGSQEANGIRSSKNARWRAAALITLNLLMIGHIIQWNLMGTTVSPIEPSEAMYTLQNGAINAGFIFFVLAILATLIFGRFVCGWGCHIVALQDLCAWLLKKVGLTPRPFRSRLLIYVPLIAALYMFVWPTAYRFFSKPANEPLIPEFTNHLVTTEFWSTFPPVAVAIPFLFICGFVVVYFLGSKGFCTYGCPYGGFFSIAEKAAPGRIRVTDACNQCGHCTATCTSNVLVHAEVKQFGMVVDPGCMKCMDCVSVCPNDALYFGFGKPSAAVKKAVSRNYSITWPEEVFGAAVFIASYFAVWNVYQLVPMLMAIGIAIVTTFLALKVHRLFRSQNMTFYGSSLKSGGKISAAGWTFAAVSLLWVGINIHSGIVRFHESAGNSSFENLRIPDELALARGNASEWLNVADKENIATGRRHFERASALGLFRNSDAMPKQAWLEFLSGNADEALELLGRSADSQSGQAKALSLYYRGAILNRYGRHEEALADLENAISERPDLTAAREELGEAYWRAGRRERAVSVWTETLRSNPRLPLTAVFLAGAADAAGQSKTALEYEALAARFTPADPYFHWMLAQRAQNLGMTGTARKHFEKAILLNPAFRSRVDGVGIESP
ncbi:MAG TPA: 4Fe-4S binding protein [Pyrinomonadaceae bacterium]|nr:4Fe-4S binding protein [Pyrinomonadaceae bacterium]